MVFENVYIKSISVKKILSTKHNKKSWGQVLYLIIFKILTAVPGKGHLRHRSTQMDAGICGGVFLDQAFFIMIKYKT